jgi:UDP-3-O-[3-hydroxymyristoyl] N-acetylglucosamine deacetylase
MARSTQLSRPFIRQHTLRQSVTFVGVGLHRGENCVATIRPAPEYTGIQILARRPRGKDRLFAARWHNVKGTDAATSLGSAAGVNVCTVEHLLGALYGLGIDNAVIEVRGSEIPILDGSAAPYVELLQDTGIVEQQALRRAIYIFRPIEVREGDRFAMLLPSLTPRVTVSIDFAGTPVGAQTRNVLLTPENFAKEIAPARTFGFEHYLNGMRQRGLIRGASTKNAILVRGSEVICDEPLRFSDEFVRHKILDIIGDLSLAGAPIFGHLYSHKPGHDLNVRLLETLFTNTESWSYVTGDDVDSLFGLRDTAAQYSVNQFAAVCEQ